MQTSDLELTIPDDVLTAHLEGEAVLLDMASRKYFKLNATAAAVWKELERGLDRGAVVDRLCAQYDVDRQEADQQVAQLLTRLRAHNLLGPHPQP
jgi:hypothetical protein